MNETRYVYCLEDPRDGKVKYVGQTKDWKRRKSEHESATRCQHNPYKTRWIKKLVSLNLLPIFHILEVCNSENIDERELYWIKQFDQSELMNVIHTQKSPDSLAFDAYQKKVSNLQRVGPVSKRHRSNLSKSLGQIFKITEPSGEEYLIKGLAAFCRVKGLSRSNMSQVSLGKRKQYKGWLCARPTHDELNFMEIKEYTEVDDI